MWGVVSYAILCSLCFILCSAQRCHAVLIKTLHTGCCRHWEGTGRRNIRDMPWPSHCKVFYNFNVITNYYLLLPRAGDADQVHMIHIHKSKKTNLYFFPSLEKYWKTHFLGPTFLLSFLSITFAVIRRRWGGRRWWRGARGARWWGGRRARSGMWGGRRGWWGRGGGARWGAGGGAVWVGLRATPRLPAAPLADFLGFPLRRVWCERFCSCSHHLLLAVSRLNNRLLLQTGGGGRCWRRAPTGLRLFLPTLLPLWGWLHLGYNPAGLCVSLGWWGQRGASQRWAGGLGLGVQKRSGCAGLLLCSFCLAVVALGGHEAELGVSQDVVICAADTVLGGTD